MTIPLLSLIFPYSFYLLYKFIKFLWLLLVFNTPSYVEYKAFALWSKNVELLNFKCLVLLIEISVGIELLLLESFKPNIFPLNELSMWF